MATSYSPLLGLALPVTGELTGTWGDTVNNSITSLLDSAIAGTTTLSTDADVTLTTTTGAANTSREAVLLFSGARTALRTITAPAQSKTYTVINSTTGGFSVKIVGVGPTTGVTIVAGESAVIAWNGSDFIKVSNTGGEGSFTTLVASTNLSSTRINPRISSAASASSLTPDISAVDIYAYTALAANLTINAPTGIPVDGNKLIFRILDNGTTRTLTWDATYTVIGVTLPTTTTVSKMLYVGCIYNAANTRWDVVAVTTQA